MYQRWDDFQMTLEAIPRIGVREVFFDFDKLFKRKTFQESMHDCPSQNWLERYNGARDTQNKLKVEQDTVQKACGMFVADVFDELVSELDAYAMGLSKLIGKPEFIIDKDGHVQFDSPGIASACESHRKKIRGLVARLTDEQQFPVWDEAYRFDKAETFEEKKQFIHRKKSEIDKTQQLNDERKDKALKKLKR